MQTQIYYPLTRIANAAKAFARTILRLFEPALLKMPSSCHNINTLLLHLCDFDQPTYRYLIQWLAYPLQYPGAKMQYAVIVNGQEGTGSSLFFERVVGSLYGHTARHLQASDLDRNFNSWALNAKYITVTGKMSTSTLGSLKALVSESSVRISQKALPDSILANQINLVFITSSPDFMPEAAHCDRRFMVIEAPPKRERLFYTAVADEIDNGGAAAFRDYLKTVDLANFNQFSGPPKLALHTRTAHAS